MDFLRNLKKGDPTDQEKATGCCACAAILLGCLSLVLMVVILVLVLRGG